ncbi:MAG: tRNA dihydrouridine synthase [Lachnospiraceae bacterium]
MGIYFAPLEGITGHIFRSTYEKHFGGHVTKYFAPFIATNQNFSMKSRDKKDILPENNEGIFLVPQILTNNAEQFVDMSEKLAAYGYREVNLNLGCPSGTVVPKKKGSGFLADPERLDMFFDEIFHTDRDVEVSVKTRLGIEDPEEFFEILRIYNRYPIKELIIHPRVQKDYYKNHPHMEIFEEALKLSKCPVCYNGDLCSAEEIRAFRASFPQVENLMLGRGLLKVPSLLEELDGKERDLDRWYAFMEELTKRYERELCGEKIVLYKLKEHWFYLFQSLPEQEAYVKKLKKAGSLEEYRRLASAILKQAH